MKTRGWIVAGVLAGVGVLAMRGCLSKAPPDERLADRVDKLCAIASDNVETPERGVRAFGRYLGNHLGDITGELGETIALIEKIPDDDAHDARAREARERIEKPIVACERTWMRFVEAINRDPAADALVERAAARLDRTLRILFRGGRFDFANLPRQLGHALDGM